MKKILLLITFFTFSLSAAQSGLEIAKALGLNPKTKVKRQWERGLKKGKFGTEFISEDEKKVLLKFLKKNAKDVDSATVPGF